VRAHRRAGRNRIILVNHGYVVGFSRGRKLPVWAAFTASAWKRGVDHERPWRFYDDIRIPESLCIGAESYGRTQRA